MSIKISEDPSAHTANELRTAIAEADEQYSLARELSDGVLANYFLQERRRLEAESARRNGTKLSHASEPITVRISDVQREEVSWLWHGRIPIGKLTLFDGDPGVGKSWLTLAITAAVTKGSNLPQDVAHRPGKVVLLTAEDGLGDTVRPRLEDMGANLNLVIALKGLRDEKGQERALTLDDIDIIEKTLSEHRPIFTVVDPVVAYMAGRDTWKASEVRGLLAPLASLAEKYNCAVIGVRHLTKQSMKAIYRGQGSIDFLAACRSAFLIGENPDNSGERVICHLKSNLAAKTPSLTFSINEGRFLWGEESSFTAEQILVVPAEREVRSQIEEAKVFLRDLLTESPVESFEVKSHAKAAGISDQTLRRAKTALGVKAKKTGFGETGKWLWELSVPKVLKDPLTCSSNKVSILDENEHLRTQEDGWEEV